MKLFIRTTGGMGITLQGNIDTTDVPEDLARRAETLLDAKTLEKAAASRPDPRLADGQAYELVVYPEARGRPPRQYRFTETEDHIDLAQLLDDLMREITLRKKSGDVADKVE